MLISIIIPVYNQIKYIKRCLISVAKQSYKEIEVIVIDDGSTDKSEIIIEDVAKTDSRFKVIHQKNGGVSSARNRGIAIAKGRYITFIDGDDYIGPQYIEHLVEQAIHTNAKIVLSGVWYVNEDGTKLRSLCPTGYTPFKNEEWPMRISAVWSHLYLRELWIENHVEFTREARGEDIPIALYFFGICTEVSVVKKCEYYYVQHQDSAMHQFGGLKKLKLPYQAIEDSIQKVLCKGIAGSSDYYCVFVFRVLITCLYLARGAKKKDKEYVVEFVKHIIKKYFPNYTQNTLISLRKRMSFPIRDRIAIVVLSWLLQTNTIDVLKYIL